MEGMIHFVLCDGCLVRNSHKMIQFDANGEARNARERFMEWYQGVKREWEHPLEESYGVAVSRYFEEHEDEA
jgi:hypothetical protein